MNLKLSEKIRELRKRDSRTQENLAEALGVTSQAVSRWEQALSYPDMELIPAIANYFGISIDELFGYSGARNAKIQEIMDKADEYLNAQEDMTECITLLRDAAMEFPANVKILVRLGYALNMHGLNSNSICSYIDADSEYAFFDSEKNCKSEALTESIQIFENILSTPSLLSELPLADHEAVLSILMHQYSFVGSIDRGIELARKQPSVRCSREVLLGSVALGEENYHFIMEEINVLTELLLSSMHSAITTNRAFFHNDYKQALVEFEESCKHWSERLSSAE